MVVREPLRRLMVEALALRKAPGNTKQRPSHPRVPVVGNDVPENQQSLNVDEIGSRQVIDGPQTLVCATD
jgi:hypothetical protein